MEKICTHKQDNKKIKWKGGKGSLLVKGICPRCKLALYWDRRAYEKAMGLKPTI